MIILTHDPQTVREWGRKERIHTGQSLFRYQAPLGVGKRFEEANLDPEKIKYQKTSKNHDRLVSYHEKYRCYFARIYNCFKTHLNDEEKLPVVDMIYAILSKYRINLTTKLLIYPLLLFSLEMFATPEQGHAQEQYFVDETDDRMPPYEDVSFDGDLGDINRNGLLDIVISNSVYGNPDTANLLLINSGDGVYLDSTENKLPRISLRYNCSSFLDVERDNDFDIYISNSWYIYSVVLEA